MIMKARRIIYPALCAAGTAFFFVNRYISARLGAAASAAYSPGTFFAYSDAALLAVYTVMFFVFRGVSPGWGVGPDYSFALWLLGAVNFAYCIVGCRGGSEAKMT